MSGGSYDYACFRVSEMADSMAERRGNSPLRRAFVRHLRLVADAMHAVEWVDSGDGADEDTAIRAVLGDRADSAALEFARYDALAACDALAAALRGKP